MRTAQGTAQKAASADPGDILSGLMELLQEALTEAPQIAAFIENLIAIFGGTTPAPMSK